MPTQRLHVQVHKLIADLVAANQAGLLPEGLAVLSYIANVAQNLNRKPQGYRYDSQVKAIMSTVFLMGGPRSSNVITHNLDGPSESTVRRTIGAERVEIEIGHSEKNFKTVAEFYSAGKVEGWVFPKRILYMLLVQALQR